MCTRWGNQSWIKLFIPPKYRYSSHIQAAGSSEKGWLVNIGLLVAHRFNVGTIFRYNDLQVAEWAVVLTDVFCHKLVQFRGDEWTQGDQIGVRRCLDFSLQNVQIEKYSRFKSGEYEGQSGELSQHLLGGPGGVGWH